MSALIQHGSNESQPALIIAQVTDIHIGPDTTSYRDIDVRGNFKAVIDRLANRPLDLLVLSGDLAASAGELEAYIWLQQILADFPHPYVLMAGNHDHVGRMISILQPPQYERHNDALYFSRYLKGWQLLFLDSSPNRITQVQLAWLKAQSLTAHTLLFVHHPPLKCGCHFMDHRYALKNIDEVWPVLAQLPAIKHIFCGHYHNEKTITYQDKSIYLTPSTIFQIDMQKTHFCIEHVQPGWRMIECQGSSLRTYTEYLLKKDRP